MIEAKVLGQIEKLERLAATVLEMKRSLRARRPIVIEFAGSPKSGKSSCISSLDIFLRRNNFKTRVLTERASVCPIDNKFDPLFNVWTGCASLNQLAEVLSRESRKLDVIIMDRGFFDTLCWFEWERERGYLRNEDYDRFISFFTAPRFRMMVDLVLLFKVSPEESINREYRNLLTRKEGSIMREKVLTGYLKAADLAYRKYSNLFRAVEKFKTDTKDQNAVNYQVTHKTLTKLSEVAEERIAYVNKEVLGGITGSVFEYATLANLIKGKVKYALRESVEVNVDFVQFIPICVVRDSHEKKVLSGKKAVRATSESSPEKGRTLLYFGGHVREEDKTLLQNPSELNVFQQCLYREVKEEIGLDTDCREENPICFWDRSNEKSQRHIAITFEVREDLDSVKLTIDEQEFIKNSKKSSPGTGDVLDESTLKTMYQGFDSWSQNIVTRVMHIDPDSKLEATVDQASLF